MGFVTGLGISLRSGLVVMLIGGAAAGAGWGHTISGPPPGPRLGIFSLTYYWVAQEQDGGRWPLFSRDCRTVLARSSRRFHDALSREGTGTLRDGRLLNFSQRCPCARPGHGNRRVCYEVLDQGKFPWGRGARLGGGNAALRPFWSLAVDPRHIPIGTVVFIPLWRNRKAPDGTTLDGCFRAEDTGTAIRGQRLDFFAGRPGWAKWLNATYGFRRVAVYRGGRRCRARQG